MNAIIPHTIESMRQDAIQIYQAGLTAVAPDRVIQKHCRFDGRHLAVDQYRYDLNQYARLFIIEVIASGPTTPDSTTFEECFDIITQFQLTEKMPPNVINRIRLGMTSPNMDTPKFGEPCFKNVRNLIIANNRDATCGAKIKAQELGYNNLNDLIITGPTQTNVMDLQIVLVR